MKQTLFGCGLMVLVVGVALVKCAPEQVKADASAPGWTTATTPAGFDAGSGALK